MARDNWETAQKLRAKAADEATTAAEREALIERAEKLEQSALPSPRPVGKFGVVIDSKDADAFLRSWLDLEDIIEDGYRTNREDESW